MPGRGPYSYMTNSLRANSFAGGLGAAVGVLPIEMLADQAEYEDHGESGQRKAEYVDLVVCRAGGEHEAQHPKQRHHPPHDEVASLDVHMRLRWPRCRGGCPYTRPRRAAGWASCRIAALT